MLLLHLLVQEELHQPMLLCLGKTIRLYGMNLSSSISNVQGWKPCCCWFDATALSIFSFRRLMTVIWNKIIPVSLADTVFITFFFNTGKQLVA